MSLLIDGIIFSLQRHGGISVYVRELLACLERQQEPFRLALEEPTVQGTSDLATDGSVIARRARLLERLRACRLVPGTTLFHSSYYRLPSDRRVPTVVTVHDFVHERFRRDLAGRAHMLQKRAAIRAAQAVICISEATRDDLLHWVGETPGQRIHVIHNGVSEVFRPLQAAVPERHFVLYIGERGGYKNFQLVLAAMAQLPDLELHCVGGGALRPQELRTVTPAVAARVRHLGFVSDEALNQRYNQALCLAYPSSHEGFGIPVVEAMRAGCPVVAVRCKAVLEVGRDALTVANDIEPDAIARAIESIRSSKDRRAALVQAGLRVASGYSWDATHRATLDVYRSLSGEPARGR